jgi:hypothetical protein
MVIAIPLANSVAHSVSTTDYLFARSVPHRGDSRDGRSGLVDISQRLGRDLSMVGHSASDPGVAWRASSWAAHTIRVHSLAADRIAICVGAPRNRRPLLGKDVDYKQVLTDLGMFSIIYGGASGATQSFHRRGMKCSGSAPM